MKTWLLAIPVAVALIAACASNTARDNGAGGSGGSSSTGSVSSGGGAGTAAGGTTAFGGASGGGAAGTSASGGGGAAGTSASGGGGAAGTSASGGGGSAGASASGGGGAAGTSASGGGGSGAAGQAGSAGSTGAAGVAGGAGGGLADGTAQFDLQVTSGGQSNHITSCVPSPTVPNRLTAYPNGHLIGSIYCRPESQGPLYVYDVGLTFFPEAVGTHTASEVTIVCDVLAGGCSGIGTVVTTFKTGTTNVEITSFGADAKSGTFTLDEFTADGHVSGSMDLTMSEGAYTVRITGRFKASLHDCGPITSPNIDPCTGQSG